MNIKDIVRVMMAFLLILGLGSQQGVAQRGWELGGNVGLSHYFGDLNNEFDLFHPGYSAGVKGRFNFNNRLSLQMGGRYVFLHGRDEWSDNKFQQARNLSFRSHTGELFLNLEFNFFEYIHGDPEYGFTPYILAGLNLIRMQPQADRVENGKTVWHDLRALGTEGQAIGDEYNLFNPGLMYGVGMKVDLSRLWSLNIELSGRHLFTDYLDDVSTVYADKDELMNMRGENSVYFSDRSIPTDDYPSIGEVGRQRGDSSHNDMYTTLSVGVMYYFAQIRCPEESRYF